MPTTKHSLESEKALEKYLTKRASELGGKALKYYNPVSTGWPDRIVLMPGCLCIWIELKTRGEKPRPLQAHRHATLRDLGHRVYTCDSREKIDAALTAEFARAARFRRTLSQIGNAKRKEDEKQV